MINLYAHQKRILERNPEKILLCWSTGSGKSFACLALAERNGRNVLIICPKSVKRKWENETKQFGCKRIYIIVSKEEFRRDYKTVGFCDTVIIDEMHFFGNTSSQLTKAMINYIKVVKPRYIYGATATPYLSTPFNIYSLAKILGHDWNWFNFRMKYFSTISMGGRQVPVIKKGIEPEMAQLVASIGDVVSMEDCVDVPEQIFKDEYFELTKSQLKKIKEIKETEYNPVVRYIKIHQVENGALKGDEYNEDAFFPSSKVDRIMEYVETNPKIAIICRYNLQIEYLKQAISKVKPVYVINGAVDDKEAVVAQIEASTACVALVNASCSEAYELPSIPLMIFASVGFSYKDYKQICGRILRINHLKKNVYVHLIVKGSVDEAVYDAIRKKEDFDVEIYAKTYSKNI